MMMGCSSVAQAMPQNLADSTQKIVNEVKGQSTGIFNEIQDNINTVQKLKENIQNSSTTGTSTDKQNQLNAVVNELEKVTISYENLSKQKDTIRKTLLGKVSALQDLQSKIASESSRLTNLRTIYSQQLTIISDPNPEIVRTRKLALTQAIKYIDMQLQLWQNFYTTETDIKQQTLIVQQKIDSFLSMIDSSAILFREGLNLLKLQRDINDALSLFTTDMPQMIQLSKDMETSWSNLDILVNTLTNMSINIKGT